ncbi:hypothetical protein V6N13_055009 [Hibiscus sabdariffa]
MVNTSSSLNLSVSPSSAQVADLDVVQCAMAENRDLYNKVIKDEIPIENVAPIDLEPRQEQVAETEPAQSTTIAQQLTRMEN